MTFFQDLLYGQVWEDERLVASLFATEKTAPTYLCIASAGEFVTHLALQGANVIAVDTSKAQLSLSALKWESRCLPAEQRRALLGLVHRDQLIHDAAMRRDLAERIVSFSIEHPNAASLVNDLGIRPESIDSFHDDWSNLVVASRGPIGSAKIERLMRVVRPPLTALVVGNEALSILFAAKTREERAAFVTQLRTRFGWRALFHLLGTPMVALGGPRRAKAAKIRGLGEIENEWIRVLTEVPLRENRCVSWGLQGRLEEPAFPLWAANTAPSLSIGSIAWVHGDINELIATMVQRDNDASAGVFDGIYLSNVPDYLSETVGLFEGALRLCKPHAPIVALRQHGANDWTSSLGNQLDASVTNLRSLPQWRYEQTAAYAGGVIVRRRNGGNIS